MGKPWSSWSLINPCSTQACVSSQAGRCLEHCLMNPFHLPAMLFAKQPFLCSSIRLVLTDAILHSQVDHRREQISFWEGAYGRLHLDKLSSQNRVEWVLKSDWVGQMSWEWLIHDHWSKSHLSARLRCSLAYWWWRWDVSVCVITLGDLYWVSRRLVQGEDERGGQSSEVVWPPLLCPGCLGCSLFPPTLSHSVSWEIWTVTKTSNWHVQVLRETTQQERVAETNTCQTKLLFIA